MITIVTVQKRRIAQLPIIVQQEQQEKTIIGVKGFA
jgi:hypothetical protein